MFYFRILIINLTLFSSIFLVVYPSHSKSIDLTTANEVPALIKSLKTGKEQVRIDAAYKLGLLPPKKDVGGAFAALIKAMKDPSAQVQIHAASALGDLGVEQAVDALINATYDRNSEVILFSAQALGDIGSPASTAEPELLKLLDNKNSDIRSTAAIALAKIGGNIEKAVPVMIKDLSLCDKYERLEAALALGYMGIAAESAIPALKNLLSDPSWNVQQEACRTLRIIGSSEAKNALKEYPQSCGSRANIKISVEQKVNMLIEDLSHPKEFSRLIAAMSLGFIGQDAQSAIPALRNLLKDQSWGMQQEACNSLHKIGTPEALEALKEYPKDCASQFLYHVPQGNQ